MTLRDHARRELELIGEEPDVIDWYLSVVDAFTAAGHSGGSASIAIPTLEHLLSYRNLSPLTDDPAEWEQVEMGDLPCWQNRRNSEAFSYDGGKTYTLLSERAPVHDSKPRSSADEATEDVDDDPYGALDPAALREAGR